MTNEVALRPSNGGVLALNVDVNTFDGMMALGTEVAKSGIFGEINSSQGMMSLVAMRDEGISVVEFKRRYRWIGNELSRVPNSLLGDFKKSGGKYDIIQADDEACEMEFTPPDGGKPYHLRIAMEKMLKTSVPYAKDGKTLKSNWRNFPDDMLFARCTAKALRRIAPELMGGVYTDAEAQDFDNAQREPIPVEEVKSRIVEMAKREDDAAKVEAAATEAFAPVEVVEPVAEAGDANVCPIKGKLFGKRWSEFETDRLGKLMSKCDKFPELTKEHVAAINAVIEQREAEIAQEAQEA